MTPQEQPDSQAGDELDRILDDYIKLYQIAPWAKTVDDAQIILDQSIELKTAIRDYAERLATKRAVEARIDEHKQLSEVTAMSINPRSQALTSASFMLNVNDFQKRRLAELEVELKSTLTKEKQ